MEHSAWEGESSGYLQLGGLYEGDLRDVEKDGELDGGHAGRDDATLLCGDDCHFRDPSEDLSRQTGDSRVLQVSGGQRGEFEQPADQLAGALRQTGAVRVELVRTDHGEGGGGQQRVQS